MTEKELIGRVIAGFTLERYLGGGASGWVYLARHRDEVRAIKIYQPEFLVERREIELRRIQRQVDFFKKVKHPGLATVLSWGEAQVDGQCLVYVEMAYAGGETLTKLVKRVGPLIPQDFVRLSKQLVEATKALHASGAIHRDIKPDNIVIADEGRVILVDFGVAREIEHNTTLTASGQFLGTRAYAAPEYLRGDASADESPAIDRYSIGATMYEMMHGKSPYHDSPNKEAIAIRAASEPLVTSNDTYPHHLRALVRKLTNKASPAERPTLDVCLSTLALDISTVPVGTSDIDARIERLRNNERLLAHASERERRTREDAEWSKFLQAIRLPAQDLVKNHRIHRIPLTRVEADAPRPGSFEFSGLRSDYPGRDWNVVTIFNVAVWFDTKGGGSVNLLYFINDMAGRPRVVRAIATQGPTGQGIIIPSTATEFSASSTRELVDRVLSDIGGQLDRLEEETVAFLERTSEDLSTR